MDGFECQMREGWEIRLALNMEYFQTHPNLTKSPVLSSLKNFPNHTGGPFKSHQPTIITQPSLVLPFKRFT